MLVFLTVYSGGAEGYWSRCHYLINLLRNCLLVPWPIYCTVHSAGRQHEAVFPGFPHTPPSRDQQQYFSFDVIFPLFLLLGDFFVS